MERAAFGREIILVFDQQQSSGFWINGHSIPLQTRWDQRVYCFTDTEPIDGCGRPRLVNAARVMSSWQLELPNAARSRPKLVSKAPKWPPLHSFLLPLRHSFGRWLLQRRTP